MMEFSDFISDQGLMDLPLGGGAYTWSISHDPPVWSRIDRILNFRMGSFVFGCVPEKDLLPSSDHFPILLDCGNVPKGSRPFKFENMWLKVEGFVGLVK
jgi:hypothetical protein